MNGNRPVKGDSKLDERNHFYYYLICALAHSLSLSHPCQDSHTDSVKIFAQVINGQEAAVVKNRPHHAIHLPVSRSNCVFYKRQLATKMLSGLCIRHRSHNRLRVSQVNRNAMYIKKFIKGRAAGEPSRDVFD